jgi:nicotinamidase-related amidase
MLRPGQPGNEIKTEAKPNAGELVIGKHVNSAFIGTDLEQRLRKAGQDMVVCVGLTTDHCVSTTARMAGYLRFKTVVVADATAAFERKSEVQTERQDALHRGHRIRAALSRLA